MTHAANVKSANTTSAPVPLPSQNSAEANHGSSRFSLTLSV
jgi:hypothetical protein